MINFQEVSAKTFLSEYWQKKPLVIRNAIHGFVNPLSPDELAGLALEEEVESRIVYETPQKKPFWHLKRGPFTENDFIALPKTHWTLLVQGVNLLVPEVGNLLEHFDFLPQWRVDDIMISFAALHGSVGPHYDNYDVFLYQAQGSREWRLTTKECTHDNYLPDLELRIMNRFEVEEKIILDEGDMLYLPPHIGHYGISLSEECMTYSFGYRSYQGQEAWDSLGDFVSAQGIFKDLYQDPNWSSLKHPSEIPTEAWKNAQKLLQQLINDERTMKTWFGCFITRLDQQAEQLLPIPLEEDKSIDKQTFLANLQTSLELIREPACRFAYYAQDKGSASQLFINGCEWNVEGVSPELLSKLANNRFLAYRSVRDFLDNECNQAFLYDLWRLQWLQIT
ncbi:MAG: cupin domain-containing protein [Legionella sp.]|uniref:JmjC domain-containing protein n=1 Tax=Legionella sp. TaxID=459 RepID=UPI0039E25350